MESDVNSEYNLLQRARQFEPQALAHIYDLYSPALYRYAVRLLGDIHTAEECVSETFARFLTALRNGKGPREHLQAYLYRIAHNWITDRYRSPLPVEAPLDPDLHGQEEDLFQATVQRLRGQRVREALLQLTPDQRQVIVLKFLEGLENEEIASALEKPVGAIKSLQHRALAALQRILVEDE
jgi:RNA polymerase sigma-70 factor (ECF subfamily)